MRNIRSNISNYKWQKVIKRFSWAGLFAIEGAGGTRFHLRNNQTLEAKYVAFYTFEGVCIRTKEIHSELFGDYLKTVAVKPLLDNINLEEVADILWELGWGARIAGHKIRDKKGGDFIAEEAEKAYNALRLGLEKLYTLFTGEEGAKFYGHTKN